jgi:hypothetical protein
MFAIPYSFEGRTVTPEQIKQRFDDSDRRITAIEGDVSGLKRDLQANTKTTNKIAEMLEPATEVIDNLRGFANVMSWVGRKVKAFGGGIVWLVSVGGGIVGVLELWKRFR